MSNDDRLHGGEVNLHGNKDGRHPGKTANR